MNAAGIEPKQAAPEKVKLLDQVREVIRLKYYSIRTEESYVGWIRKFILFHGKRHPAEMAEADVRAFLSHLATHDNVTASTQNQAFLGSAAREHREPVIFDRRASAKSHWSVISLSAMKESCLDLEKYWEWT